MKPTEKLQETFGTKMSYYLKKILNWWCRGFGRKNGNYPPVWRHLVLDKIFFDYYSFEIFKKLIKKLKLQPLFFNYVFKVLS